MSQYQRGVPFNDAPEDAAVLAYMNWSPWGLYDMARWYEADPMKKRIMEMRDSQLENARWDILSSLRRKPEHIPVHRPPTDLWNALEAHERGPFTVRTITLDLILREQQYRDHYGRVYE